MTDRSNIGRTNSLNSSLETLRGQGVEGKERMESNETLEGREAMKHRLRVALDLRERVDEQVQLIDDLLF